MCDSNKQRHTPLPGGQCVDAGVHLCVCVCVVQTRFTHTGYLTGQFYIYLWYWCCCHVHFSHRVVLTWREECNEGSPPCREHKQHMTVMIQTTRTVTLQKPGAAFIMRLDHSESTHFVNSWPLTWLYIMSHMLYSFLSNEGGWSWSEWCGGSPNSSKYDVNIFPVFLHAVSCFSDLFTIIYWPPIYTFTALNTSQSASHVTVGKTHSHLNKMVQLLILLITPVCLVLWL